MRVLPNRLCKINNNSSTEEGRNDEGKLVNDSETIN